MTFTPDGAFPVELLPDGRVRTGVTVRWTGTRGDTVLIEAGTISDGATRPRVTAALVDQWGRASRAFLVHDVLCERQRVHWEAMRDHKRGESATVFLPSAPAPLAFDSVDTDGALRAILRELGSPLPLRWIYWTGVRWGALGSRYRWAGWWRTLPQLLALTPLVAVVLAPAVAGAVVSTLLLRLVELVCWPFTGRRPRALVRRRAPLTVQPPPVPSEITEELQRQLSRRGVPGVIGEHGPEVVIPLRHPTPDCPVCGIPHPFGGLHHTPESWAQHLHDQELIVRSHRVATLLERAGLVQEAADQLAEQERAARRERSRARRVARAAARQVTRPARAVAHGVGHALRAIGHGIAAVGRGIVRVAVELLDAL